MRWGYRYFRGGREERVRALREALEADEKVLLAVAFGSFVELESYRDIDVAVYATDTSLAYIARLGAELEARAGVPVDVVPLAELEPRFRWRVLARGLVLVEKVPGLYEALLSLTQDEMLMSELW